VGGRRKSFRLILIRHGTVSLCVPSGVHAGGRPFGSGGRRLRLARSTDRWVLSTNRRALPDDRSLASRLDLPDRRGCLIVLIVGGHALASCAPSVSCGLSLLLSGVGSFSKSAR
jgi:hypothetical protein